MSRRRKNRNESKRKPSDPHVLARAVLRAHWQTLQEQSITLRYWKEGWWEWNGRSYRPVPDSEMKARVNNAVRVELDRKRKAEISVTPALVTSVLAAIQAEVQVFGDPDQPFGLGAFEGRSDLLVMENGLLDLKALVEGKENPLLPHTPEWFSTVELPYSFDVNATCPRWLRHLDWMFEGDSERIAFTQEWVGYCFTPDTSHQLFLVLIGSGANGKGVLLEVLHEALGGGDNVSALTPQMMSSNFGLVGLMGKLANICADIELDSIDEGRLKALTGGDRVTTDVKFKNPITFKPTAKLIFATNNPPRIKDTSDGVWRRMRLLPCNARVEEGAINPNLAKELKQELSGIFNWAVQGLRRLRANGRFTSSAAISKATTALRETNDPAGTFLRERCEKASGESILTTTLQKEFENWCEERGEKCSQESLGRAVKRAFNLERKRVSQQKDGKRGYEYPGLRLKLEADATRVPDVPVEQTFLDESDTPSKKAA